VRVCVVRWYTDDSIICLLPVGIVLCSVVSSLKVIICFMQTALAPAGTSKLAALAYFPNRPTVISSIENLSTTLPIF